LSQLAQIEGVAHWQTSDINPNANPLVETDHGPGIGASAWQLAQTNGMGQCSEASCHSSVQSLL